MAEIDGDLLKEFQDFMESKRAAEAQNAASDEEIEVWDADGKGIRAKRSVLKPFLQQFGIDVDALTGDDNDSDKESANDGAKPKPKGRQAASQAGTGSITRKYFQPKK
jgi:hypothetical protein